MSEAIIFKAPEPGRRRRFTVQQKRALLDAAEAPGASISSVAREHGLHASMLFQWRRAMEDGEEKMRFFSLKLEAQTKWSNKRRNRPGSLCKVLSNYFKSLKSRKTTAQSRVKRPAPESKVRKYNKNLLERNNSF